MIWPLILCLQETIALFNLDDTGGCANINPSLEMLVEAKLQTKKHDIATLRAQNNNGGSVHLIEHAILLRHEKMAKQAF